ncbi:MAG: D-tyrosyl-tRNA(Tyr) deacylase [Lentisphaeria bacterium]|nr:D-tyrosyl-tRNA(Tyr) deacylase [Lentisphaeria bacterium]
MRALLQRVRCASVEVEGQIVGSIGPGLLVFLGVAPGDTPADAEYLAEKTAHLRIFEDEEGRMNRCVLEAGSAVLAISQFTLYADCRKGRRPGFSGAAAPETADPLYRRYAELLKENGVEKVERGVFGADMLVRLENDGPATFLLESK